MRHILWVAVAACCSAAWADSVTLPVTADVGICAHPDEVHLNTGGKSIVRVKGNEHYYLFAFDPAPVRYWKIEAATLHVKLAGGHLRQVAFCTVPCEWVEGASGGQAQPGSTCFTHVKYPTHTWPLGGGVDPPGGKEAHAGGTMMDATFNSPYMRWEAADVKPGADGWLEIPIHPDLIYACAVGLSHGLVMSDEKGQTRENHDIYAREQSNDRPYLTVEGKPLETVRTVLNQPKANAGPYPPGASFQAGAIRVDTSWSEKPLIGSRVELLGPRGRAVARVTLGDPVVVFEGLPPGESYRVEVDTAARPERLSNELSYHDAADVKASPVLAVPKALAPPGVQTMPRVYTQGKWTADIFPAAAAIRTDVRPSLPVGASMPVPLTPRNAWVALQVAIFPPDGKAEGVSVRVAEVQGIEAMRTDKLFSSLKTRLYRTWYVLKDGKWVPEVLVPLAEGQPFDTPRAVNGVEGRAGEAIFVDLYVPPRVKDGMYPGRLIVSQDGKDVLDVPLAVVASPAILPDEFHIIGDMNTYDSPADAMGTSTKDPKAYIEMERKYYRLAHAHRMTLNVLPYSQAGEVNWRGAPRLESKGAGRRIADWSEWDDRYGPLLSGEAFTAKQGYVGPGEGVPIHHMYLPFHENWPCRLAEHFQPWPPPKDYQKFLQWAADLPPIEKCLGLPPEASAAVQAVASGTYARDWQVLLKDFCLHLSRLNGGRTRFQVYLNDKYDFRDKGGRGIGLWLLDEPMAPDDFRALQYFGAIARPYIELARRWEMMPTRIDFRVDISRPTHQRQWLDGLVDLNVCPDHLYEQRRHIAYRRQKFGEEYWNYHMPPSFAGDNLPWAVWPVRGLCWGAAGTLPWQTIGSDGDLTAAEGTALMYPGRKFGLDQPLPSLRMKAWRAGLQDAELMWMLRAKMGWNDVQLRAFVGQVCSLAGWEKGMDPSGEDPIVTFAGLTEDKLDLLRRAALEALQP